MQRLMIADDSAVICKVAKRILTGMNFLVVEASNTGEALEMCEAQLPSVLVVDAGMPDALKLITTVRQMQGGDKVKIFYSTIENDIKVLMVGKRAGADDFLIKPFDRNILETTFGPHALAA
ncbi:response regulator [Pseudohoeflea coraliihabitans]|uniref:Response regulator n=1 Tax=Pseudohoeflea coraliihabitans TaxID=2860393 RepID=A0ABS6WK03_9HYPH|nr:response regulator [Pseudohoeflea sp. DP4N28-3]MBW3096277.1 response regulator [Pseudohoeflea sp. DP4N28-3]